jgi:hypothetical protein
VTGAGAAGGIALINTLGQLGGIVSPVMVGGSRTSRAAPRRRCTSSVAWASCARPFCLYGLPATLRRKEERVTPRAGPGGSTRSGWPTETHVRGRRPSHHDIHL